MASSKLFLSLFLLYVAFAISADAQKRRGGRGLNVIDRCWRKSSKWAADRQRLAACSVGFAGKMMANRGRGLKWYTVTDPSDDPVNPQPGTLRYGATIMQGRVWITFQRDMQIKLQMPVIVKSYTTIDGRGADVQIAGGAGFLLYKVSSVIIHGIQFHHCTAQGSGSVIGPAGKMVRLGRDDGDAIRLIGASKVWIDHNTFSQSQDGLLDVTRGSTAVTISNNWFRDHDKVMLLGHHDSFVQDRKMRVTLAFNRFGPNCNQRMPRIRNGYAHVVNNFFEGWGDYAIGGSMNPTIRSEANLYVALKGGKKEVTSRIEGTGTSWTFVSLNDKFLRGAFFQPSGKGTAEPGYSPVQTFPAAKAGSVRRLTRDAGALSCSLRFRC